jgi:hypothetical protein
MKPPYIIHTGEVFKSLRLPYVEAGSVQTLLSFIAVHKVDPVSAPNVRVAGMCVVPKSRYVAFSATVRHEAWVRARFVPIAH